MRKTVEAVFTRINHWIDFRVVYPLFYRRFTRHFKANPKMRQAFLQHFLDWEQQHEASIQARRAALHVVDKNIPDIEDSKS